MTALQGSHVASKLVRGFLGGGLLAGALLASAGQAKADLIGDTVSCSDSFFGACSPASAEVVEATFEFLQYTDTVSIDLSGNQIVVQNVTDNDVDLFFAGTLLLSDLDWIGSTDVITGFSIDQSFGISGLDAADLSFTGNSVSINFGGTYFERGAYVVFNLTAGSGGGTDPDPVPEPATLSLLGLGLAGLAAARRRRRV